MSRIMLYHTAFLEIPKPDIRYGRKNADFGQGFYTSMDKETNMHSKEIKTGGISYLELLEGTGSWYWGMDYTSGDLYEAEELYQDGHPIKKNRLIFVNFPEGEVYEPVIAGDAQYLGRPVYWEGSIYMLLVDFSKRVMSILDWNVQEGPSEAPKTAAELPLDAAKDCYNLMLETSPLCLLRQGRDDDFQVIWPEQGAFAIDPRESLYFRDGERLIFSKWFEDPYYREELIIRKYPTGEILEQRPGGARRMPDGQLWLLK